MVRWCTPAAAHAAESFFHIIPPQGHSAQPLDRRQIDENVCTYV